ncbi:hypothetical protein N3K66_007098 [Trichothecium roseum]|uniref:Uncharacterized protein n=1 Tax=Trichothecium roseum TaxID=47278 RepID=A0ACC0UYZ4_9HYPO|nr:hypothetical protein N3K66_007098 [Trichothecium roseum]
MASNPDLRARLAAVLPRGRSLTVHHLSTPPTKTDALYSAPPGERPDRTYRENHFLAVSIPAPCPDMSSSSSLAEKEEAATTTAATTTTTITSDDSNNNNNNNNSGNEKGKRQVLILGVEIFIYTTAKSTTIFVAKADSTGYLSLLDLPRGAPSPIREVTATFISFLVDARQRPRVPLVLSLFARSQSQYLFPGSVENAGKHVLDDRGLVKWWCRVLNPMLPASRRRSRKAARAYITIPGLDEYETRSFFPPSTDASQQQKSWAVGIPLDRLSHYAREFDWVPPRCLIPRFPDDPKSRFRDELDEEAHGSGAFKTTGSWKSVRNLDTFWEMMAYRQECSSGRMTGFIWVVFDDESASTASEKPPPATSETNAPSSSLSSSSKKGDEKDQQPQTPQTQRTVVIRTPSTTPRKLFPASKKDKGDDVAAAADEPSSSLNVKLAAAKKKQKQSRTRRRKRLSGPIVPRAPRVKTEQRNYLVEKTPAQTKYYAWPPEGRGGRVVSDKDYRRMVELLLHLDFATLDKAASSTRRWASEVGLGRGCWGYDVEGEMEVPVAVVGEEKEGQGKAGGVNNLGGLVKRKRTDSAPEVKTLGTGLIRKKPRPEEGDEEEGKKTEEK